MAENTDKTKHKQKGKKASKLKILPTHASAMKETERHIVAIATVRSHNNRLMTMINWVKENYSTHGKKVIVKLKKEQCEDKQLYYKSTHDFNYSILEPELIKAFLSANKVKAVDSEGNEKYYSFDNLRKYKDAILFGAKRAKVKLSDKFQVDMNSFIDSWKKENQAAKKDGKVTEQEADPITFPLYRSICDEAISRSSIFYGFLLSYNGIAWPVQ